ncbi:MAG: SDR family NAD(P)-dependent oxidoreductase, partial [Cyclobacteriaceae bacterium]
MSNFSVRDKVILITGGSGALGGSLAENFAREKAVVLILSRDKDEVDGKVGELKKYHDKIYGYTCNVLDTEKLKSARDKILSSFDHIDALINCAGGNIPDATQKEDQTIFDLKIPAINDAIELNMHGTVYPSLIFGEAMAKRGRGSIINISSMATLSAITRVMGYSLAKTGINSFTQWLATELAIKYGDKIRVNAIAPGFFIGEQNRKLLLNEDGSLTERSKKVINKTPMGRFGDLTELNGIAQFLCT